MKCFDLEKSGSLVERDKKVVAKCQHLSYFPLSVARNYGATIVDDDATFKILYRCYEKGLW